MVAGTPGHHADIYPVWTGPTTMTLPRPGDRRLWEGQIEESTAFVPPETFQRFGLPESIAE